METQATTFTYDAYTPVSQLKSARALQTSFEQSDYTYDPPRNRRQRIQGQPGALLTTNYRYDWADRLDRTLDGQSQLLYDCTLNDNGNLTSRTGTTLCDTFSYDQANRLTQAVVGNRSTSTTSTYGYDGDGLRMSKTVGTDPTIRFVWDVNGGLPVLLDDGNRKYVWGQGLAYAVDSAGALEVYPTDGLDSVRALTDGNAQVVQTYQVVPLHAANIAASSMQARGQPRAAGKPRAW